jgi:hypothetical protein
VFASEKKPTGCLAERKHFGFRSKETLTRALDELLDARLIIRTCIGRFTNPGGKCALYALAWPPIDDCRGKQLDVGPTRLAALKLSVPQKN